MYLSPCIVAAVLAAAPSIANCYVAGHAPRGVAHPTGAYNNSTVWITQTVTAYQTYCPTSTKFKKGTNTYTATAQTWVTVTDCPKMCTISNKAGTQPTVAPVGHVPVYKNATSIPATKPTTASYPCAKPTTIPAPSDSKGSSNSTGSTGSCNSTSSTGSSGAGTNGPATQTTSAGERLCASLFGLAIVALVFLAL